MTASDESGRGWLTHAEIVEINGGDPCVYGAHCEHWFGTWDQGPCCWCHRDPRAATFEVTE